MGQAIGNAVDYVRNYKAKALRALEAIPEDDVAKLIALLVEARAQGRQIFVCGNGGSAATASHFATDLGKGASLGREKRFKAMSLVDNVSWLTAMANDTDYSQVFLEPLKNFAQPGDLLIAFSGSGNSPNVVRVVEWANQNQRGGAPLRFRSAHG